MHYVKNGYRPGRSKEIIEEVEANFIGLVIVDRVGREKSSEVLGYETSISSSSMLKIPHKHKFSKIKPTIKLGLNEE